MGIDIQELREGPVEAPDAIAATAKTIRRTVRRRATGARKQIEGTANAVITGNLPSRAALHGLRLAKDRARRKDIVGNVLYVGLSYLHRGLTAYERELGKFQAATRPPVRNGGNGGNGARRTR